MLVIILTYMKTLLLFIIIYTYIHEKNNALSKSLQLFNKINVLQENALEELLGWKQEHGVEIVQKVLDMRGLQVRVLTNLEKLNAKMKVIDDQTPMPELQHNVKFILDKVEVDIQKLDNQNVRHESEGGVTLEGEGEGAALERDYTTETIARQHRGYYGSHWIESSKVLW
jgi:hypothetical protein